MILGGSTNAVLHLIAIAHSVGIKLSIDDFQTVSDRTPFLADLKPSGKYVMEDVFKIGGIPCLSIICSRAAYQPDAESVFRTAVLKYLLAEKLIDGNTMTVTGKTLGENLEQAKDLPSGQEIIRPLSNPIKSTGHLRFAAFSAAGD